MSALFWFLASSALAVVLTTIGMNWRRHRRRINVVLYAIGVLLLLTIIVGIRDWQQSKEGAKEASKEASLKSLPLSEVKRLLESRIRLYESYPKYEWPKSDGVGTESIPLFVENAKRLPMGLTQHAPGWLLSLWSPA
jgi:hypothetical protein